jgi:hypothetical protein
MTIPPLIMIAQGRKPRLRKAPLARPKEIALHMRVAAVLRNHARPDWQWTHIANGEARDPRTAGKLKQMGLQPGWPDFVIISPRGQLRCLELKRIGESLSDAQDEFRFWCIRNGVPHVTAHTMREVLVAFDTWDCLSIKAAGMTQEGGGP